MVKKLSSLQIVNTDSWTSGEERSFEFINASTYTYYRIEIDDYRGLGGTSVVEIEMMSGVTASTTTTSTTSSTTSSTTTTSTTTSSTTSSTTSTTTSSTTTTTTTVPSCWWNDDFTGDDDDPPDNEKWNVTVGTPTIQGNEAELIAPEELTSEFTITGDFDIQVDVDVTGAPNTNSWGLQLKGVPGCNSLGLHSPRL